MYFGLALNKRSTNSANDALSWPATSLNILTRAPASGRVSLVNCSTWMVLLPYRRRIYIDQTADKTYSSTVSIGEPSHVSTKWILNGFYTATRTGF